MSKTILSSSPNETKKIAAKISKELKAGDIVALIGNLGGGKTTFIQGLAEGLKISKECYVNSPTFTLLNEYKGGRLPLYHFDFYRLNSLSEFVDLGFDEYFNGKGICAIEWAEKFMNELPKTAYKIKFEIVDETTRRIELPEGLI